MISKAQIANTWKKITADPRTSRVQKKIRKVIIAVILGVIVYQIYLIGWQEVVTSLPTQPLFYILFGIIFLTLPTAEVFIYQQVWKVKKWESFKAFLTKRVYNEEVMGYSGEFYLFMWARRYLDKDGTEILKNVRDNNILSSLVSNFVAFSLVGLLIFTGVINIDDLVGNVNLVYVTGGAIILVVFVLLIIQFRRYLFSLSLKKAIIILSIYLTRFLIHHGLLILQWAVVIPDTPLSIWLTFAAIIIVVNRIPFLPSRDLIFLWAGIELSRMLNMATASVAGMLLVYSALKKCTNFILFLLISYYSKDPEIQRMRDEGYKMEPADDKMNFFPDEKISEPSEETK